jgi:serine/threonine protein kinase/formylglycine-generating enzyme required for sulfatase activity
MAGPIDLQPPSREWAQIQELAERFGRECRQAAESGGAVDLRQYLPPEGNPLRPGALHRLIQVELEVRWQRGQAVLLESYLVQFPELGTSSTLPLELIYHEYRIRQLFGDRPKPDAYSQRFPEQFPQLMSLIQGQLDRTARANATMNNAAGAARKKEAVAASPPPPPSSAAPVLGSSGAISVGGKYQLIKKLGSGTFGEVWKAEGPGGTDVAIKVISRPIDQREAQQELQALEHVKRLRHPYLVQTHAYWIDGERLHIVMDLADSSLAERGAQCRDRVPPGIPWDELLSYMEESAEALDYLHAQKVHHRDVKPPNILLLQGHVKLADFGLARPLQAQMTFADATAVGTPAYMSPEVWTGKVSQHSDQWSFAITYSEMRLNRRMFQASDIFGLMREICAGPPDLVGLEESERQVVMRALAPRPADRFPSCREFVAALREVQRKKREADTLAEPAPPGPSAKAPGPAGPMRRVWAALLLLVCLAGVSLASALVLGPVLLKPQPTGPEETRPSPDSPAGLELDEPPQVTVVTGRSVTLPLALRRRNFSGAVCVACLAGDVPRGITVEPLELGEDETRVTVKFSAAPDAVLGTHRIRLQAEGMGAGSQTAPSAQAVVELTVLFLPPGFEKDGDKVVADGRGVPYYQHIARVLPGGTRIGFVLVPQSARDRGERRQDTFYMMENKVSLGLFRTFAQQFPDRVGKERKWDRKGADVRQPVFDVTVTEAHAFASAWLKGNLPTVEQWDKAAGRFEKPRRGEGPYTGKWTPARKDKGDIAIKRATPLPVGTADGDVSAPYGCRDMAGNGYEWTRTLAFGKGLVPVRDPKPGDDNTVLLRGRCFTDEQPLRYEDLDGGETDSWPYLRTRDCLGFRVVIEPQ